MNFINKFLDHIFDGFGLLGLVLKLFFSWPTRIFCPNDIYCKPQNLEAYDDCLAQTENGKKFWIMKSKNRQHMHRVTKANAFFLNIKSVFNAVFYGLFCSSLGWLGLVVSYPPIVREYLLSLVPTPTVLLSLAHTTPYVLAVSAPMVFFSLNAIAWFFMALRILLMPSIEKRFIKAMERMEELVIPPSPPADTRAKPGDSSRIPIGKK
ncbi:hypothetical protein [Candidatus Magnetaquicoccus inordinatus]|uniref:hypothetical protein n=1 Tax=Candidatus Magnetaquicoccus inordinatus TaxID=2496818 RepID=UPI00102AF87A|nr:hypothetical protein [Candidatus Magnetaquicoccus inordinatus]